VPITSYEQRAARIGVNAGELDKLVALLKPVYNEFQDEIVDWEPVARTWAGIVPETAEEPTEAGRAVMVRKAAIIIRHRSDIDARWRIAYRDRMWEILGFVNVGERNVRLEITCMEVY
jgi:SPP1 family predicted phage head-tail adaptor